MKKLLCVLMFGVVFGQDISTKEFTLSFEANENSYEYDISEYFNLEGGWYELQMSKLTYENLDVPAGCCTGSWPSWSISTFYDETSGGFSYGQAYDYEETGVYGLGFADFTSMVISFEDPVIEIYKNAGQGQDVTASVEITFWLTGRFDDTDVGLNGDMNEDNSLDVLDVVMLVDIILSGGMGDVGDLLNIVTG